AAIAPLSQATMLDIYPFSRRAQAMAIFSMGVTMGPVMGPTLGGYLTEMFNCWYGFAVLAIGCGSLQLMLDRGQELDWFSSREILVEAVIAGTGFYLFIVH